MIKRLKNIDLEDLLMVHLPCAFFGLVIALSVALIVFVFVRNPLFGLYPFGPKASAAVTIERLYVDGGKYTHYMVGTDKGVFEMDDSIWLGIYNVDELYARLQTGKTYQVELKGNKLLTWYCSEYPHITSYKEIK